jgi:hypothetical protein
VPGGGRPYTPLDGDRETTDAGFVGQRGRFAVQGRFRATALGLLVAVGLMGPAISESGAQASTPSPETLATSRSAGEIVLGDKPVRVVLDPPPSAPGTSVASRLGETARDRRVYLLVSGLRARQQPGVLYHVYLDPPSGADDRQYVGSINFFNSVPLPGAEGSASPTFSFDITDQVRALQLRQRLADPLAVTVVPAGAPARNAQAVIGEIALVAG